jgi:hypothetical protein
MTAPHRRWSYSLRMLFVLVTACGCGLGYPLNWMRQRHDVLAGYSEPDCLGPTSPSTTPVRAPLSLALLGERGYGWIQFEWAVPRNNRTGAQYRRLQRLFPEAIIGSAKQPPGHE